VRQLSVWPLLRTIRREDREIPFLLAVQGGYISGVIDAMTPEGVLVDYKTGRFDERRHARYCWQLWVYAAAVRALRGVPAREGLLVYVDEGRCERVPLGEAEVGHALREAGVLLGQLGAPPGA
jgi:CRISPR/Cas system-associated exonuclease Cas4 (RecB family)